LYLDLGVLSLIRAKYCESHGWEQHPGAPQSRGMATANGCSSADQRAKLIISIFMGNTNQVFSFFKVSSFSNQFTSFLESQAKLCHLYVTWK